jgi:putative ABC transport system permease protein
VRRVIADLDPDLPVSDVRPFSDYRSDAFAAQRFTMMLAASFAGVAILLACIGTYGVTAYAVARRYREFGVRLTFGARPLHVIRLVMSEGVKLAAAGLAVGIAGALGAARLLQHQLFGVTPLDPASYLAAVPALGIAVVVACWLPARRAAACSPVDALRTE